MQFGRTYGIGLMILGILLCSFQIVRYMAPPQEPVPQEPRTAKTEHVTSSLPGIIGAGSLVAGMALFITARRKDEPDPKHAVK